MRSTCLKSTAQTYDGTSGKCGRPTGKEQSRLPDRYLGWTFAACLAPPNLAGFFLHDPLKERDPMREWFFYAIMALLVFGHCFWMSCPVYTVAVKLIVRGQSCMDR